MENKQREIKKKTKKKIVKTSTLKKKAWDLFSRYIRMRDCLKTEGHIYEGKCYTCGKTFLFENLQAGHFIDGRKNNNLFDERGVHAQCYQCNVGLKGNKVIYTLNMQRDYGQTVIDEMLKKNREPRNVKGYEYLEMIEDFKKKIEGLSR
jgi:hypothetical protein